MTACQKGRYVYLEQSFAKDMVDNWSDKSLTTTSHAIEVLHILSRKLDYKFEISPPTLEFVSMHAVPGGYKGALTGEAEPDLYATRSAIVVHKADIGLTCNKVLGKEWASKAFGTTERADEILDATVTQLDGLLEPDAVEGPAVRKLRKITDLHHALYIVRNIASENASDLAKEVIERRGKIAEFLVQCYRDRKDIQGKEEGTSWLPAFALACESKVCCLTAYFFAENIYRYCKLEALQRNVIGTMLESARGFVRMCFDDANGYGCLPGQEADLVHTYFGISLNGDDTDRKKVESFVHRCRKGGGYALLPEWKPSAYGTRIVLQILDTLGLPIPETIEIKKFIEGLKDRDTGGYRGYYVKPPLVVI